MLTRRFLTLAGVLLVAVAALVGEACDLNPQPLPPGVSDGTGTPTAGSRDAGGGGIPANPAPSPPDAGGPSASGPDAAMLDGGALGPPVEGGGPDAAPLEGGEPDGADAAEDARLDAPEEGG